ncbi:PepSY-associated TM helix domain-containing protein [Methylovulum miyakonense]|uniref:PepSY-associated TM helix domain-containing protein n=1 Tax=Methylovulum miyakonense TaxID=645578 RepID=UPI00036A84B8|nr:PepSY-associated TM helix domain-containing protein [Methylovulum miyakonense]
MKQNCHHYLSPKKKHRKLWLQIHLYLGLTLGAMFALIGLTGSLIVFWQPLDAALNPVLLKTNSACIESAYRPLDQLLAAAQNYIPAPGQLGSVSFPNVERPLYTLWYQMPAPEAEWNDRYTLYIDPCNGTVTGPRLWESQLRPWAKPLMGIILKIHTSLMLNFPGLWLGNYLLSFGSALLMGSIVVGVYLWWPRIDRWLVALKIKRNASAERLNYDLHKTFGIFASLLLLVSLFSGIHMYKPWTEWIDHSVNALSSVTRLAATPISQTSPEKQPISAEQAVNIAKASVPNGQPVSLSLPENSQSVYSVSLATGAAWESDVLVDQYSGNILQRYSPETATFGDHLLGWLFPLHTGRAFGLAGRILILFLGLIPTVLYVTGFIRWRQKRKALKIKQNIPVSK